MSSSSVFSHRDLDGTFARLIRPSILEYRDPNDGQTSDPAAKSRHQYTVVNATIYKRHLPPEAHGDAWRGQRRPPAWESIGHWPPWDLLTDWCAYLWRRPASRYTLAAQLPGLTMTQTKRLIVVDATDWPQSISCPHSCGDWIVWNEAGYVPGWRTCAGCGRHWRIVASTPIAWTEAPLYGAGLPIIRWVLRRAGQ